MFSKLGTAKGTKVQAFSDLRGAHSPEPRGRPYSSLSAQGPYSSCSAPTPPPSSPRIYLSQQPGKPQIGGRPHSSCGTHLTSKTKTDPPVRSPKKHRLRFPTAGDLRNFSVLRKRVTPERAVVGPELLSEEELLQNIRGENGRWKQKKAQEVWMDYLALKEEEANERQAELQRQKQLKQEQLEREARMQQELIEHRKEEAKRRKRMEEELQRQKEIEEEKERLRKEEEERLWRARQPRPCETCKGTGECQQCAGKGCFHALYLSPQVTQRSLQFVGRTVTGCLACGGQRQLEKDQVKVRKGTGKCWECKGSGMITPKENNGAPPEQPLSSPSIANLKTSRRSTIKK